VVVVVNSGPAIHRIRRAALIRCRVSSSLLRALGACPSRIVKRFHRGGVAGTSGPLVTSRRRHFRSGSGFHLRRGRSTDEDRPESAGLTGGGRRGPEGDVIDHRHDRALTATDRGPHGHSDAVATSCDTQSVTFENQAAAHQQRAGLQPLVVFKETV